MASRRAKVWDISRISFLSIFLSCVSMMAAWSAFNFVTESYQLRERREEEAASIADRLAYGLANPVWNYDSIEIAKIAEYELISPDIHAISVESESGSVFFRSRRDRSPKGPRLRDFDPEDPLEASRFTPAIHRDIEHDGLFIGKVDVYPSAIRALDLLGTTIAEKSLEMAFFVAVLMAVTLFVNRRSVVRPVKRLAEAVSRFKAGGTFSIEERGALEIRTLTGALNDMTERLNSSVSERERLLEEVRQRQELISSFSSNVPGTMFRTLPPPDYTVKLINDNAQAVFGAPAAAFLAGRVKLRDFIVSQDRQAVEDAVRSAFERGGGYSVEYRIVGRSEGQRFLHETGRAVLAEDGSPRWLDGIAVDVTEEKAKDDQLAQAQKMDTIGSLAGGIAHDFNNILSIVMGTVSLLKLDIEQGRYEGDVEGLKSNLEMIDHAADRASTLVNQLLTLSRRQKPEMVALDLGQAVAHIMKLLSGSLDKSIKLEMAIPEGPAPVKADPLQIEQVVLNLCVNSAHAMTIMRKEGEPWGGALRIGVEAAGRGDPRLANRAEAEDRDYWAVTVSDTGVGMSAKTKSRLFTPFFTTKPVGHGTGLGLSIVYSILKGHNGFLEVRSEEGAGTAFTLFLPAAGEDSVPGGESARSGDLPTGSGTVLVVDDEEAIRSLVARVLSDCGYSVLTAGDGEAAFEIFKAIAGKVDLVILDMVMPALSGKETFRRMREIVPEAKVLLCSGFRNDERVRQLIDEEGVDFLAKPYPLPALARKVSEMLSKPTRG